MSKYLENFKENADILVFNGGKTGVVDNCKIQIEKKGENDSENSPIYKLYAYDELLTENVSEETKIYPVNKGFFYKDSFPSDKAEKFAVNELRHLLKTFGHEVDEKNSIVPSRDIKDYNDFLDYTMKFINSQIKNNSLKYKVVVAYGHTGYSKEFLQLEGYPWYIGKSEDRLSLRNDAITERPEKDKEDDTSDNSSMDWTKPNEDDPF